jgi:hypothetical protein
VREAQHHAHIPLFVVEYTGWAGADAVRQKLGQCPKIAGVLVIGSGVFVSRTGFGRRGEGFWGGHAIGPWSLWGLISSVHEITNSLHVVSTDPLVYAQ